VLRVLLEHHQEQVLRVLQVLRALLVWVPRALKALLVPKALRALQVLKAYRAYRV
jgi:hypothetical protein